MIGEDAPLTVVVAGATPVQVAAKPVIEPPPLLAGAVNEIVACWKPADPVTPVGTPGAVPVIANAWVTGAAAAYPLPAAELAVIEQLPAVTIVMFKPLTVHTAVVVDVSVGVRPTALVVALDANGVVLKDFAPGLAKVIVCGAADTTSVKFCVVEPLAFVAVNTAMNEPVDDVMPDRMPAALRVMPAGRPAPALYVGAGEPFAVTLNVLAVFAVNVVVFALLNAVGAAARLRVNVVAGNAEKTGFVAHGDPFSTKIKFEAGFGSTFIT